MRTTVRRLEAALGAAALATTGLIVVGLGVVAGPTLPAGADTGCTSVGSGAVTVTCSVGPGDSWTVPPTVTSATFLVEGAAGGTGTGKFGTTQGGGGGELRSTLAVTAGQTYGIEVGTAGGNGDGTNGLAGLGGTPGGGNGGIFCASACIEGGGGGGASFVDMGGADPSDWLLMAGGGGGGGGAGFANNGGNGGGLSGMPGFQGAGGGTQVAGSGSGTQLNGGNDFSGGGGGGGGGGYWGGASGTVIGEPAGGGSGFITGSATGTGFLTGSNSGNGSVTITYDVDSPPTITSGDSATFTSGTANSFTVTTSGFPIPTLRNPSEGPCAPLTLPDGVTFTDNEDGTATISTTTAPLTDGTYPLCLAASNGITPDAAQTFTLTVDSAPAFTSADSAGFDAGTADSFPVTTSGAPDPSLTNASEGDCMVSSLPAGLSFTDNDDGTGTIASTTTTPAGTYTLCLAASNGVTPTADQTFTLTVTGTTTALTVAASPSTAVYGTSVTFTGNLSGGLTGADEPTGSISLDAWPLINCNGSPITGEPSFSLGTDNNVTSGNGTYTLGTQSPSVGTYHLNDYFDDADGFNDSVGSGCDAATLTVTQAPLSISAPTESIPFGTTPNLTPIYHGLVNGDTPGSLTNQATCTTKATATSAPGSYKVTCAGAVDPNYAITYTTGKITITLASSTFSINDFLTKGPRGTTAVFGEVGIPTGAHGTVTFKIGTRELCTITLTGQPNEATTCMANLGLGFSGAVTATFSDTDGDYASSSATNQLHISF